jgi:hypothetical protein
MPFALPIIVRHSHRDVANTSSGAATAALSMEQSLKSWNLYRYNEKTFEGRTR